TETSANKQCPPRKETRLPSGRCVHRAASSRTYCRLGEREGLTKTRATTSQAFWAAGNRRSGACADSRVHCLSEPRETQLCAPPDSMRDMAMFRQPRGSTCSRRGLTHIPERRL